MSPRWTRHPRALWRASLGRVVVLPPDCDEPQVLLGSGVLLWQLLAVSADLDTLASDLAASYEVEAATVRTDIEPVLAQLTASGALTVEGS